MRRRRGLRDGAQQAREAAATAGLETELPLCVGVGHTALPGRQDHGTRYLQLCGCPTGSE
jgi:hypothetical protein